MMKTLLIIMLGLATQASLAVASSPGDTGACCLTDPPTCFENLSEFSCLALGGQWLGAGSTCEGCDPDPTGACCFDGNDCSDLSSDFCAAISGTWLGPNTTCAQHGSQCSASDPTGACCIGVTCTELTESLCLTSGGDWLGAKTTCAGSQGSCVVPPLYVPQQYDTIEEAIVAAENGREIIVAPGVHFGFGSTVFDTDGKSLYIHSSDGAEVTFIDGEDDRRIVTCTSGEDNGTLIEGFTMINGASFTGAGIRIGNNSSPIIRECIIRNCVATRGGGCAIEDSSPIFELCAFVNNESLTYGGGIDASEGSDFQLLVCSIEFNEAGAEEGYAGVNIRESSNATLFKTFICDNTPAQILGDWTDAGGNTICSNCIGDLTGTGEVGGSDLTVILGFWGPCADPLDCPADLTGDGYVDGADITVLLAYWGPCP